MVLVEIVGYIFFWLIMLAGIIVIPFGIPGTFVIIGNALVYGLITDFAEVTWKFLGVLLVIAVLAEAIEFVLGAAAAGKYGGSRLGMTGAIVGGFLGAVWGTPIVPPIGIIFGAFAGAFVGAALLEYFQSKDLQKSLRVGYGAFLGTLGGKLTKIVAAIAMVVMVGFRIF